ncbi:MAG: CCA tRNA nucleotidyltransferase [Planctomycetaceae bacterium]|nr:CCA tRNA nucleotidyltransferase [Planctomycetaceae bacterium]
MTNHSPLLSPPPGAMTILHRLRDAGHTAYLCGGCVRDALLGKPPKDYDIATSAAPDAVEALFDKTLPIGKAFGVVLVDGGDDVHYEVATFRADLGYADGRRPDGVVFSSAEEDAKRRDFTMNALFYDPFADTVIDYVGGRQDIQDRVLRTVGVPTERFREDHLRLLRAIRFAARTGFRIEDATGDAVRELAGLMVSVSPERIAAELEGMLTGGRSRESFAMLKDYGLLVHILPEVDAMAGVEQPPDFHPEGDVWEHTLLLLGLNDETVRGEIHPIDLSATADIDIARGMHTGDFSGEQYVAGVRECREAFSDAMATALAWAGLLHDIGKPGTITYEDRIRFNNHDLEGAEMAAAVLERLRRPRRVIDWNYDLIRRHIHFSTLRKMRKSKLRRWLQDESFPMHLELHRLDCVASHRMLANWFFGVEAWREEKARLPEPEPLLRGGDLVKLGIQPGPEIGRILRLIDDARLEGDIHTRDDALALAESLRKNI